jgi:hypothetical protein
VGAPRPAALNSRQILVGKVPKVVLLSGTPTIRIRNSRAEWNNQKPAVLIIRDLDMAIQGYLRTAPFGNNGRDALACHFERGGEIGKISSFLVPDMPVPDEQMKIEMGHGLSAQVLADGRDALRFHVPNVSHDRPSVAEYRGIVPPAFLPVERAQVRRKPIFRLRSFPLYRLRHFAIPGSSRNAV